MYLAEHAYLLADKVITRCVCEPEIELLVLLGSWANDKGHHGVQCRRTIQESLALLIH